LTKVVSQDIGKFYHHYPKLAIIVTAQAKGKENAMAVAWHTSISAEPPLYGISVSPKRLTYQLIVDSKEFGVNFLPVGAAELIASVGGSGGQEMDKFQKFNITKEKSVKTSVPILEVAYASYECKLVDDQDYGDHRWLVGEIVAVHLTEEAFTEKGTIELDKVSPALYLGDEHYLTVAKDTVSRLDRQVYGRR
jgi:flavin reductase (DIM6/NTAB) family NADH-FMN oxidoreductase RutF